MQKQNFIRKLASAVTAIAMGALMLPQVSFAGNLTSFYASPSRNKLSATGSMLLNFTPASTTVGTTTITVTFQSGFTIASTGNWLAADCQIGTTVPGLANCASSGTGVSVSGQVVTLTLASGTTLTASTAYYLKLAGTTTANITNPGSAGSYTVQVDTSGATSGSDSGIAAVAILTEDDVTVTGAVNPKITLTISGNPSFSSGFTVGSITTATNTVTVSTNAGSGYTLKAFPSDALDDSNSANAYTAVGTTEAAIDASTSTSKWGIYMSGSGLTGTVGAAYDNGSSGYGLTTSTSIGDTVASATGAATSDAYTVTYGVYTKPAQPKGTYTGKVRFSVYGTF